MKFFRLEIDNVFSSRRRSRSAVIALWIATWSFSAHAGSINVTAYWPMSVGSNWVYDCANNQGQSDSVSVTSQAGGAGQTNFVQVSAGCVSSVTYQFSSSGNGVLWNGVTGAWTASPAVLFLPATANPGDTFASSGTITTPAGTYTYSGSVQVIGLQEIAVPAGRFNALAVTQTLTLTVQTPNGPYSSTTFDQVWLGSAIGELKRVEFSYTGTNRPATPSVELDLVSASVMPSDAKDDCSSDCGQNAGDPINIRTGNSAQAQVDYRSPDGLLDLVRIYNSTSSQAHTLGVGWRHSFDRRLTFVPLAAPRRAVLLRQDGKVLSFWEPSSGFGVASPWLSDPDLMGVLTPTYSGGTTPTGWVYVNDANEVEQYDANGNLVAITGVDGRSVKIVNTTALNESVVSSVTDNFGHALVFQYDSSGRVSKVTDPAGKLIVYGYDSAQNLGTVTYQDGTLRTYHYNEQSQTGGANLPNALTSILDESGHRYVSWQFNASGQATNSQLAGNIQSTTLNYSGAGTSIVTDGAGTQRTINFSSLFGVTKPSSMSAPSNSAIRNGDAARTYDANGNLSSRTDFDNNKTCLAYDLVRNLELVRIDGYPGTIACPSSLSAYSIAAPPAGSDITERKISTTWHPNWRLPTERAEPAKITTWVYNGQSYNGSTVTCAPGTATVNGLPIAVACKRIEQATSDTTGTLGFGATALGSPREWDFTYSAVGQVLTAKGPRTDVNELTTFAYFSCTTGAQCGHLQTVTNALSQVTTYLTYNGFGQPLTLTDPNNVGITLGYDLRGRLTSREVGTETTAYGYYPNGLLKNIMRPDSSVTAYLYNAANLLDEIDDSLGNRLVYTIDAMGNRSAITVYNGSGSTVRTHGRPYDSLNRLASDINAANTLAVTTSYGYDTQGNLTSIQAPLGRNTTNHYDALNRLSKITDPNSGITQISYDATGRRIGVTDPRNLVTAYTYDGYGDLLTLSSPDTGLTKSTFDPEGNLITLTDARSALSTASYDALNRKTKVVYSDQTIQWTYDAGTNGKGRLTGASDANHSMSYTYDSLGRITGKGQTVAGVTKSVGYGYTNGDRVKLVTPSGQTVTYGYNNHQITSIAVNGTSILSGVTYFPFGPVSGWTWGNATTVSRTYNTDGNVSAIATAGDTVNVGYDNATRITSLADTGAAANSWTLGYDLLDRLNTASKTGTNYGWTYDADGNRVTQTGTTPETFTPATTSNRLSSTAGGLVRTYAYDLAGNTASYQGVSFTFNQRERMSLVTASGGSTSYIYNALGELIEKSGNGGTTLFVYDESGHLLGEYSSTGALVEETIWLGDTPVATLRPNGTGITVYNVHTDQLNAPRKLTTADASNKLVWRWDTDPFGTAAPNQNPSGLGTFVYNLRFPGQYYLAESGLNYNYLRSYDPQTGRFIESDPIGLRGGVNTYAYVGGHPISNIDPLGLQDTAPGYVFPALPFAPGTPENTALGNLLTQAADNLNNNTEYLGNLLGGWIYGLTRPQSSDADSSVVESSGLPPGYWPGSDGAAEWGVRNGVGAREGKNRFHRGVKQNCPGAKPTDAFGVNPDTGDVVNPNGEYVDNLGDVDSQK